MLLDLSQKLGPFLGGNFLVHILVEPLDCLYVLAQMRYTEKRAALRRSPTSFLSTGSVEIL